MKLKLNDKTQIYTQLVFKRTFENAAKIKFAALSLSSIRLQKQLIYFFSLTFSYLLGICSWNSPPHPGKIKTPHSWEDVLCWTPYAQGTDDKYPLVAQIGRGRRG